MCSNENLKKILDAVRLKAVEDFGNHLAGVILYGSYARKEATDSSDIDIMVLVNMERAKLAGYRRDWNHFGTTLDLEYDVLVSFKLQDEATFYAWKDTVPFYRNVINEGVKVVA